MCRVSRTILPPFRLESQKSPSGFWGEEEAGELIGVMGIQDVQDVTLIRHAYVRTARQGHGVGGRLLAELRVQTSRPVLMGTWAAAAWAVRFYQRH